MRPVRPTAVHKTDRLAELVCSNSFRGDKLDNAVGLLKEEMRRLGSLVMRAADADARAGRRRAGRRPRSLRRGGHGARLPRTPCITVVREEVAEHSGRGQRHVARRSSRPGRSPRTASRPTSPAASAPSTLLLRRDQPDRAGRDDRHVRRCSAPRAGTAACVRVGHVPARGRRGRAGQACGVDDGQGDYLNCPLTPRGVRRVLRRARPRRVGDGARFRQGDVLRGVPADRGDGAPRASTRCASGR